MTDWTPIATAAIAGSSGIVGAGLGYLTARYQSNVEIRRIQSELDKVRIEHGEEHLRHRQAVYHDFSIASIASTRRTQSSPSKTWTSSTNGSARSSIA